MKDSIKTFQTIDDLFLCLYKNIPNLEMITVFCRKGTEKLLLDSPNVVRKGRWLYYRHKNKDYYIRLIKPVDPEGSSVLNVERIKVEPLKDFAFLKEDLGGIKKQLFSDKIEIKWNPLE